MASNLEHAVEIYRSEGAGALVRRSVAHLHSRGRKRLTDRYWDVRGGTMELDLDGVTARYEPSRAAGGDAVRWWYEHERRMLRSVLDSLDPDDVFLDVGAGLGIYSCFCANKLTDGTVAAVEPYEPNREQLRRNLSYNGDATVIGHALSNHEGTVEFEVPETDATGAGTPSIAPARGDERTTVQAVPGDELVRSGEIPPPNVVKIDVEGAEPLVLEGLRETLRREGCRAVFCEVHLPSDERPSIEDHGYDLADVTSEIRDAGFEVERLDERGRERHLKATK